MKLLAIPEATKPGLMSELLIMSDGKIYVHNLTPEMAAVLSELNPGDETIRQRVLIHVDHATKKLLPPGWDSSHSLT